MVSTKIKIKNKKIKQNNIKKSKLHIQKHKKNTILNRKNANRNSKKTKILSGGSGLFKKFGFGKKATVPVPEVKTSPPKNITHFWLKEWPDHAAIVDTVKLKEFIKNVDDIYDDIEKNTNKNTVIHCSAGVGRSGTFFVILKFCLERQKNLSEILRNQNGKKLNGTAEIVLTEDEKQDPKTSKITKEDIKNAIIYTRLRRPNTVQSIEQYKMILDLFKPDDVYDVTDDTEDKKIERIKPDWIEINQNFDSFGYTISIKDNCKEKNRYGNILPYDNNIVSLKINKDFFDDSDDCNDYINASYLNKPVDNCPVEQKLCDKIIGFDGVIISTQAPKVNTIKYFMKMLYNKDISRIIMIGNLEEEKDGNIIIKINHYIDDGGFTNPEFYTNKIKNELELSVTTEGEYTLKLKTEVPITPPTAIETSEETPSTVTVTPSLPESFSKDKNIYSVRNVIFDNDIVFNALNNCIDNLDWTQYISSIYAPDKLGSKDKYVYEKDINTHKFNDKNKKQIQSSKSDKKYNIYKIINNEIIKYGYHEPLLIYIHDDKTITDMNPTENSIYYGSYINDKEYKKFYPHLNKPHNDIIKFNDDKEIPTYGIYNFISINYNNNGNNDEIKPYMNKLNTFFSNYKQNTNLPRNILFIYNFDGVFTKTKLFSDINTKENLQNFNLNVKQQLEKYFGDPNIREKQKEFFKNTIETFKKPEVQQNLPIQTPSDVPFTLELKPQGYSSPIPKVKIIIRTYHSVFDTILKCINIFDWAQYIDVIYAYKSYDKSSTKKLYRYINDNNNHFLYNNLYNYDYSDSLINEIKLYGDNEPFLIEINLNGMPLEPSYIEYGNYKIIHRHASVGMSARSYFHRTLSQNINYYNDDEIPTNINFNNLKLNLSVFDDNSKNKIYIKKLQKFLDNYKTNPKLPKKILIQYNFNNVLTKKNMYSDFKNNPELLDKFNNTLNSNDNKKIEEELHEYFEPSDIRNEQKTIFKYMKKLFEIDTIGLKVEDDLTRKPLGYKVTEIPASEENIKRAKLEAEKEEEEAKNYKPPPKETPISELVSASTETPQNNKYSVKFVINDAQVPFNKIKLYLDNLEWIEYIDSIYAPISKETSNNVFLYDKNNSNEFIQPKIKTISGDKNKDFKDDTTKFKSISYELDKDRDRDKKDKDKNYKQPFLIYIDDQNSLNAFPSNKNTIIYGNFNYMKKITDYKTTPITNSKKINIIDNSTDSISTTDPFNCISIQYEYNDESNKNTKPYMKQLKDFLKNYKTYSGFPKKVVIIYDFNKTLSRKDLNGKDEFNESYIGEKEIRDEQKDFFKEIKEYFNDETIESETSETLVPDPVLESTSSTSSSSVPVPAPVNNNNPTVKIIINSKNAFDTIYDKFMITNGMQKNYIDVIYAYKNYKKNSTGGKKFHKYKSDNNFEFDEINYESLDKNINNEIKLSNQEYKNLPFYINIIDNTITNTKKNIYYGKYEYNDKKGNITISDTIEQIEDEIKIKDGNNYLKIYISNNDDIKNIKKLEEFLKKYKTNSTLPKNILVFYDFNIFLKSKNLFEQFQNSNLLLTEFNNDSSRFFESSIIIDQQKKFLNFMKTVFNPDSSTLAKPNSKSAKPSAKRNPNPNLNPNPKESEEVLETAASNLISAATEEEEVVPSPKPKKYKPVSVTNFFYCY